MMTPTQSAAFKVASGNVEINVLYLLCVGFLLAALFFWTAWGMVDVYNGWANTKIRNAALIRFCIRAILLLVLSIWMFAS